MPRFVLSRDDGSGKTRQNGRRQRIELNGDLFRDSAIHIVKATPCRIMPDEIQLTDSVPTYTAVIRGRVPRVELARFVPAACGEVWSFIHSAGLPRPGRHVAVYLDAEGLVEVGAEISEPFIGNDRVQCSQLPSGPVATIVHFGPYARLSETHTRIRQWCAEHGHHLAGVSWEIYGHWDESWNSDPSKIRTDVFHLLQGRVHAASA